MNKLLLVVLAICLVSTHAFVKRDAPAENNGLKKWEEDVKSFVEKSGAGIKAAFDPENVKKSFNQFIDSVSGVFNSKQENQEKKAA